MTEVTKYDLVPRGLPRWMITVVPNVCFAISGLMLCNLIPATDFLMRYGVFSEFIASGEMTEFDARHKLLEMLNVGSSVGVLLTPAIDVLARLGGGLQFLSIFAVATHIVGMLLILSAKGSTWPLYAGRLLQCLSFPAISLVIPCAYGLFPGKGATLNAFHCFCGDMSVAFIPMMLMNAVKITGLAESTIMWAYLLALYVPVAIGTVLVSPEWGVPNFSKYISAWNYKKGLINESEYLQAIKNKDELEQGEVAGYNPSVDPLIWSYSVKQAILTKETLMFIGFFACHFLRIKKCLMPYLDYIMYQKGGDAGVSKEEVEAMLNIMHSILAFGWVPGIGFGIISDMFGTAVGLLIVNIICSCGYWLFQYTVYTKFSAICLAFCYALNSGVCFGAAIAFINEIYGPRLISFLVAAMFFICGVAASVSDMWFPKYILGKYLVDLENPSNPMGIFNDVTYFSAVSLIFNCLLIAFPPPGPPGADYLTEKGGELKAKKEEEE